jgi:hypothetical protein
MRKRASSAIFISGFPELSEENQRPSSPVEQLVVRQFEFILHYINRD